jgi:hypothetical protein
VRAILALQRWLSRPLAPAAIIALAVLLSLPFAGIGRGSDDFVLTAALDDADLARGHAPFDLFAFATGDAADAAHLRDVGAFPWWADASSRIHFFRPLASLTHAVDHALWPDSPTADHLHSACWYALAVAMLWLVLRRSSVPRGVAALGLLLYAVDSGHAGAVAWISSRNSVMAATFGFATLWAHDRWRRGVAGPMPALAWFALALASGEGGVATLGYLVAYSLVLEAKARLRALAPYVALLVGFSIGYALGRYGAACTSQYIDPVGEPLRFAGAAVARLPIYLETAIGGPPSDAWIAYAMIHPALPYAVWALAVSLVGAFVWLAWPVIRADRECRFWLVGSVLATLPACAGFPSDRLLLLGGAGGIVAVSRVIVAFARDRRRVARGAALWLAIHGVVLAPLAFVARGASGATLQEVFAIADRSLPADPAIADKTVVILDVPLQPMIYYALFARAADGRPRPARTWLLATGAAGFVCERIARDTVRLASRDGLVSRELDMMLRAPHRDLRPGEAIELAGLHVVVDEVTGDGRPAVVRFRFDRDLDDPQLVWMRWSPAGLIRVPVPALGRAIALPGVSLVELFSR